MNYNNFAKNNFFDLLARAPCATLRGDLARGTLGGTLRQNLARILISMVLCACIKTLREHLARNLARGSKNYFCNTDVARGLARNLARIRIPLVFPTAFTTLRGKLFLLKLFLGKI